jgi:catalase
MFAYPDAARYRLGVNYQQLPCNRPVCPVYSPFQRDGFMNANENYGADPNYVGSALKHTPTKPTSYGANDSSYVSGGTGKHNEWVNGVVSTYTSEVTDEDFVQPREFWEKVLAKQPGAQDNFVANVVAHLGGAVPVVQKGSLSKSLCSRAHLGS